MGHGITSTDSMFSVRERPWHGLGVVLDQPPKSIDDALDKSGLGWGVKQREVYVSLDGGQMMKADGFKANVRTDNEALLGIVSDDYQIVDNREAFRFMDSVLGTDLLFETAGSLNGGRRVFVTARLPEWIEVGGDTVGTYLYVANSHDGTLAVTAAVTPVRIVCANTLGMALRRAEGADVARTFKFRHTGDLQLKYDEARKVMGLAINYETQFKKLGDMLGRQKITTRTFEKRVVEPLFPILPEMGKIAQGNRRKARETVVAIFEGRGRDGDTTGNAAGTKWCAVNAVAEFSDYHRRYTKATNQVQRSMEDNALKDRALELVLAA